MNQSAAPARVLVFVVGVVVAAGVVAGLSVVLPSPLPFALGIAVYLPFFDAALYPRDVPNDAATALRDGGIAAGCGVLAGVVVSLAVLRFDLGVGSWGDGLAVAVVWVVTQYVGRRFLAGRRDPGR